MRSDSIDRTGLYLLRCDDNETYKATARRNVREWIKANASSQSSQLDPFANVPSGGRLVGFVVVASEEVNFQVWGLP
jgi:hypothetical protein